MHFSQKMFTRHSGIWIFLPLFLGLYGLILHLALTVLIVSEPETTLKEKFRYIQNKSQSGNISAIVVLQSTAVLGHKNNYGCFFQKYFEIFWQLFVQQIYLKRKTKENKKKTLFLRKNSKTKNYYWVAQINKWLNRKWWEFGNEMCVWTNGAS